MSYKFDFAFMADRWPDFVAGAWVTVQLTVLAIALGFALGTVCALARVYGGTVVRRLVGAYVELIRNTPLLIQIFIVYFGLSSLGLKLGADISAVIALTVNKGAYSTEIMRAGQIVNNSTFEPFVIFSCVAAIYFALCYPLSVASRYLERKAHAGR